jgi:hypothetical protein
MRRHLTERLHSAPGLLGLRDRVEVIGGTRRLTSASGAGTSLRVLLPLDDEAGSRGLAEYGDNLVDRYDWATAAEANTLNRLDGALGGI